MKKLSIFTVVALFMALSFDLVAAAAEKNPYEKDVKEIKALKKQIDDLQGKESPDQKAIDKLNKKYEAAQSKLTKKAEKESSALQKSLEKAEKKISATKDKGGDVSKLEEEYKKIQDRIEQVRKWSSIDGEGGESKDADKKDDKEDKKDDKKADKEDKKDDKSADKEDEEKDDKSKKSKK